jgi:F0F1-type ATP synthase membrane subunit b/b'
VLVLDAETQLVACFILFCSTMYTQVGGMIGKSLDDYSKDIYDNLKNVDNSMLEQINTAVEADKQVLSIEEDFKQFCEITNNIAIAQADVLNHREAHAYREAVVKKLDSLHALEESAVYAIRTRMLTQVKAEVVNTFTNDKKAKEAALNRAIEVLASGAKGKLGKDIVGEAFSQALNNYKDAYAKQPAGSDPILKQLEKDMAAVAQAPVVDSKGGNVFVTHPLIL